MINKLFVFFVAVFLLTLPVAGDRDTWRDTGNGRLTYQIQLNFDYKLYSPYQQSSKVIVNGSLPFSAYHKYVPPSHNLYPNRIYLIDNLDYIQINNISLGDIKNITFINDQTDDKEENVLMSTACYRGLVEYRYNNTNEWKKCTPYYVPSSILEPQINSITWYDTSLINDTVHSSIAKKTQGNITFGIDNPIIPYCSDINIVAYRRNNTDEWIYCD